MGNPFSRTIREATDSSVPGHVNYVAPDGFTNGSDSALFHRLPPLPSEPPMLAPVTPDRSAPERYDDMARLKLQSHQVKPFSGRSTEFPKWRSHTECVFNGTGYERVLSDETYAKSHPLKNALVFSQLSIALCDGDASHLVDQHKNTQNGHQAWHDLLTYFYGSNRSVRAARVIRAKLGRLTLTEGMTASAYINKFQTWHRDLSDINNGEEGFSTDTKIQAFLDNIKHPKYLMTVGCIKNITELDMETAIDRIRQTETDLDTERGEKRKMSVLRRQFYVEDGFRPPEEEDDSPGYVPVTPSPGRAKKRRRLDNPGPTKLPKEIELKKSGAIHIVDSETWNALPQSDKDFVSAWNSRTRHKESTKDIKVPTGVTLKPYPGSFHAKRVRRQGQGKSPTAAMVKADKKRIHFGLEFNGDEIEDADPDFTDDE
jgi:hypothetical protein